MASALIRRPDGLELHFPRAEKERAFRAMELIRHRLEIPVSVIQREDPETGLPAWGIRLNTPGREVRPEELATARDVCEIALEG
jgi:hypothetical protein